MLWISRLAYSMQSARHSETCDYEHRAPWMIGLKVLLYSSKDSRKPSAGANIIHFHTFLSPSPSLLPSSPPPKSTSFDSFFHSESVSSTYSSSSSGDLLGTESGVHMVRSDSEELNQIFKAEASVVTSRKMSPRSAAKKEYAPHITLLRDGMPWKFCRHYTDDGSLVITKEYASSQVYTEADRSENDRLVLKLALLDECNVSCHDEITEEEDEQVELGDLEFNEELDTVVKEEDKEQLEEEEDAGKLSAGNDGDDNADCVLATSLSVPSTPKRSTELEPLSNIERCVDLSKCFTYAGDIVASNPFLVNFKALENANAFLGLASSAPLPPNSLEMLLVRV